jgi:hypothetical protein
MTRKTWKLAELGKGRNRKQATVICLLLTVQIITNDVHRVVQRFGDNKPKLTVRVAQESRDVIEGRVNDVRRLVHCPW